LGIDDPLSDWDELSHLTLARALLAQTKYDEALILLNRLLEMAVAGGRISRRIEFLALLVRGVRTGFYLISSPVTHSNSMPATIPEKTVSAIGFWAVSLCISLAIS
jgi:hypothetical protein